MIINSLTIKNFRNHEFLTFDFSKGINAITGPNASGKTSVVEAIYYLSLARSFRGVNDNELIRHNAEFPCDISAKICEGNINKIIRIIITNGGRRCFVNGKPITKLKELLDVVNVVLFEPKNVFLFQGQPKDRRNFLDINLAKKSSVYYDYLLDYEKILKERNEILKSPKIDETLLETNTEMLVKKAGPIVQFRQMYIKDINDILNKITRTLAGENNFVEVNYKPFVPYDNEFEKNAIAAFNKALESDLRHKSTSIGIQREDFSISLNGKDIASCGSQGQNRLVAIAIKLAPYFLIKDEDKRPIVILDDVMSELDQEHRQRLIKFLKKFEQVFITGTKLTIEDAKIYQIKK